jgi:hypothetical protein
MATSVQVSTNGGQITVKVTAGPGYNPASANVQVIDNATGQAININPVVTANPLGGTCTFTFNGVPAGDYTVTVTCGGETTVSTVYDVQAKVNILAQAAPLLADGPRRGAAAVAPQHRDGVGAAAAAAHVARAVIDAAEKAAAEAADRAAARG